MDTSSSRSTRAGWFTRLFSFGKHRPDRNQVKSFKENQKREEAFPTRDRGVRSVPLDKIVGSVGRYNDLDDKFRLKQHVPPERLQRIKSAMKSGKPLPPVKLYQIKDEYFVLDGNHRIAAAKEFGWSDINAKIVEFIPTKNTLENVIYRERAQFEDRTRLSVTIPLTEIGQYDHLLQQITEHQSHLESEAGKPVAYDAAAKDWYQTIYKPLAAIIKSGGLVDSFPRRTLADLYVYVSTHQWEQGRRRRYGIGIDRLIPKNMEAFRTQMASTQECDYPEMKRWITAYVLMNVKAKHEYKIMDKLFALQEVREIHSVHGAFDIIVKIVLSRDLLSSDAEIIGQFVHENVRQLAGISATQTLIPGLSKFKEDPNSPGSRS